MDTAECDEGEANKDVFDGDQGVTAVLANQREKILSNIFFSALRISLKGASFFRMYY